MNSQIKDVYIGLGKVLDSPQSYGLAQRAPERLVETLTRLRCELLQVMKVRSAEYPDEFADDDPLLAELSQDSDSPCNCV